METVLFRDLSFSRLMLGTVQLGLDYGVANRKGRPAYEEARAIVAAALAGGVNSFDTAARYGESESVLGRVFAELDARDRVVVASKVQPLAAGLDPAAAEAAVRVSVRRSLERLGLATLPVCLFHLEDNHAYLDALLKLKAEGLVRCVGVSVYRPDLALQLVADGRVDALQVPASVLDHRFRKAGVFAAAARRDIGLFVRSVFLQGLLLMPETDIPAELAAAVPVRRRLAAVADAAGLSTAQLAAGYILGLPGVTCALAGVDSAAQMNENLALFSRPSLGRATVAAVEAAVPDLPERLLVPSHWSRRMPAPVLAGGPSSPAGRAPDAN